MSNNKDQELQTTAPRVLFGALTGLTGFLVYSCLTPPHPPRTVDSSTIPIRDSVTFPGSVTFMRVSRTVFLAVTVYQALYIAFSPSMREGAPQRGSAARYPLNKTLLTFNRTSIPVLLLTCMGALLRIYAFQQLGANFTFNLQAPNVLKTDGLYEWVQHPSYVSGFFAFTAAILWFGRVDGVLGVVAPDWMRDYQREIHRIIAVLVPVGLFFTLGVRVWDEEKMLRQTFGVHWELWHRRTARFVPGVF